jgi:hypothetical protein
MTWARKPGSTYEFLQPPVPSQSSAITENWSRSLKFGGQVTAFSSTRLSVFASWSEPPCAVSRDAQGIVVLLAGSDQSPMTRPSYRQ